MRLAKVLLFGFLLLFVLVEGVAVAGYFARTGTLYYLSPPTGKSVPEKVEGQVEGYRIHPYLGFILRPTREPGSGPDEVGDNNAFGFVTPFDYPYLRQHERELLVGIFGGSAASCLAELELREKIITHHLAGGSGREVEEIRVLNFAQRGFKQPQQLLIYTYLRSLGQELDVVVSFDGFDDVALAARNGAAGIAVDMPSIEHVRALQEVTAIAPGSEGLEKMLRMRREWALYRRIFNRGWGGEAWELRFASGFLVDWLRYRWHHRRYLEARLEIAGTDHPAAAAVPGTWFYLNPSTLPPGDPEAAIAESVRLWSRASELMSRLVEADGGFYFLFVQPNQYFPTERAFTEAERAVAFHEDSPDSELIPPGYRRLEQEVEALRRRGVAAEGLFRQLDGVPEAVYVDDCCHFTDAGQAVLAEAIGRRIASEWRDRTDLVAKP